MDAIEQLKTLRLSEHSQRGYGYPEAQIYHGENEVALDMAIEALEWQKRFDDEMYISKDYHDKVYAELQKRYFDLLVPERTRWIPVRERWPGEVDGDKYGTVQWCVLYKGQHQIVWHEHYQWRSKDGVQTHWMRMFNLPEQEV